MWRQRNKRTEYEKELQERQEKQWQHEEKQRKYEAEERNRDEEFEVKQNDLRKTKEGMLV